jgi:hypothetical protein
MRDIMPSSKKPVIFFDPSNSQQPILGKRCSVYVTTVHPKIHWTDHVLTSLVQYIYKDGSFRTMNSIYKPEPVNE